MSRSKRRTPSDAPYQEVPEERRHYVGRSRPELDVTSQGELHWYEAYLMGYKATAWPKDERDRDDMRYDLREKEEETE